MPPDSSGPVVFLTGAAGGIGRAVVTALRARDMRIFATDLALADLPCGDAGMSQATLDVRDHQAIAASVARCLRQFSRIDHVVHLAGRTGAGPMDDISVAQWRDLLAVNLDSGFYLAQSVHAPLAASRGTLTFLSSSNGRNGGSAVSGPAYAVAKAGLINLMRYLSREWAPEGIRVNAIAPGPVDTPMLHRLDAKQRQDVVARVPLGRLGRDVEVAWAVQYLLDERAGFVTGSVLNVSGGVVLD
ncbi:MAG: SDR family oxidoreductase [Steroidobacteraceae bacterium]